MITGLNYLNLAVSNMERSFYFYRNIVGLKPLCKWPNGAYFLAGEAWLCLHLSQEPVVRSPQDYTHLAFSVSQENFDSMVERLTREGVISFKENISEGDSFYFLDPDANKLELHVGDWQSRIAAKKKAPWPNTEFFS